MGRFKAPLLHRSDLQTRTQYAESVRRNLRRIRHQIQIISETLRTAPGQLRIPVQTSFPERFPGKLSCCRQHVCSAPGFLAVFLVLTDSVSASSAPFFHFSGGGSSLFRESCRKAAPHRNRFLSQVPFLPEHGQEMALSFQPVRPEADGPAERFDPGIRFFLYHSQFPMRRSFFRFQDVLLSGPFGVLTLISGPEFPIPLRVPGVEAECLHGPAELRREVHQRELRMASLEILRAVLILRGRESTGRVDEKAAAFDHHRRLIENLFLTPCAVLHILRAPHQESLLFLPEHSFPGAGSIHDYPVKKSGKPFRKLLRCLIRNHRVGNSHPLHILRENLRPPRIDLIGDQKSSSEKLSREHSTLSSRRRTQIQHLVAGLCARQRRHRHRTRLLQVVKPRLMKRRLAGPRLIIIEKTIRLRPRRRPEAKICE